MVDVVVEGSATDLDAIDAAMEEHADWLETQLALIERLGENAYAAEQMHE